MIRRALFLAGALAFVAVTYHATIYLALSIGSVLHPEMF